MTDSWVRQPEETEPAFAAFAEYRDYERSTGQKRSLSKVAQRLHKSHALIARWSARHNWLARVGAWDGHLDVLRASAAEALTMRKSVSIPITAVARRLQANPQAIDQMPIEDLVQLIPTLAKALATIGTFGRLLRGESTANAAVVVSGDIEMQEAPTDEGYLRRFVMAAVEAGILDDEPPGETVAPPADPCP